MSLTGCLTIDLDAIAANWRALDGISLPNVETAAVVKADAYGCGAEAVAPALRRAGAKTFFVALPGEGVQLRQMLGSGPVIYVLGGYHRVDDADFGGSALRPVLNSRQQLDAWLEAHRGEPAGVQLDTGMNRLGMEEGEIPHLPTDGSIRLVMSHLACADEAGSPMNHAQLLEFSRVTDSLSLREVRLSLAATGGILLGPEYHQTVVRPGIGLFGGLPFSDARPAVGLTVPVIQLRDVAAGQIVGYGATWAADGPRRIATLSAGYADGLIRALGNRAFGYSKGRPLPFVGRVSMDLVTLDVTDAPDIDAGDPVELLGPDQTIDQLADAAGTIGYEILTSLGSRYRRRYRGDGSGPEPRGQT